MFVILHRYLFGQTVRGVLIALSTVLVLIVLIDFVEQTRTVEARIEDVNLFDFFGLTLLKTPMLVETTLPFILLFGIMLTMFQLNRRSELVVMRASGISAWRFVAPALAFAVLVGMLSPTLLNPVATALNDRFVDARATITGGVDTREREGASWYRELGPGEQRLIRAERTDAVALTLYDVTFIILDAPEGSDPVFASRVDADSAQFVDGQWVLAGAVMAAEGEVSQTIGAMAFPAYLDTAALGRNVNVETIDFWRLPSAARAAAEIGVSPTPYRLRWLRLLTTPVLFAAMALIACAASMRLLRLGGALQLAVLGGLAGFGLYFFGNMLEAFALGGRLPPILAAAGAPFGAALAALAVIAHFENA